ncbi:MAG TPA: hypothetical protein VFA11_12615 [Acidimicrobiales bacterium]|nr:hypothetical protein [Acidimicrobiales bacterium]
MSTGGGAALVTLTAVEGLADLEQDLRRIPGVGGAKVVVSPDGEVTEVHIVAGPAKHPKQVVRDVQTVALAHFGVEIDRRVVSVVQMGGADDAARLWDEAANGSSDSRGSGDGAAAGLTARPRIGAVSAVADGLRYRVEVTLSQGDEQVVGAAVGPATAALMPRLVAKATLDALLQLETVAPFVDVESAAVVRLGERDVALVGLVLLSPSREDLVVGAAPIRGPGLNDAVARAVLDATNRRFPWLVGG